MPHEHRAMAESFGGDAERYDRARPRYPQALVEHVTGASPGRAFLDVGCGTGIAARQFLAAGCTVLGVEPDARMAEVARRLGVDVEVSTFEAWEPAGRRFDAVVSGQAWHWIDPVAGAAKAARVLRPGGVLALFWNVPRLPPAVAGALAEVYARVVPDAPFDLRAMADASAVDRYRERIFGAARDGLRETGRFAAPREWRQDWEYTCTREAWLEQLPTSGALTRLPPDRLAQVLDGAGAAVDALGGSFPLTYATVALTAVRTGAA
nr:class I SAM-dependent methyltransferase [Streptomyces echinoruber]